MRSDIVKFVCITGMAFIMGSCHDLDMNPLSSGSTESWYSSVDEIRMAVNKAYQSDFLLMDGDMGEGDLDWSDDTMYRQVLYAFQNATLTGQDNHITKRWINNYKLISKMNAVINKYQRAIDKGASESEVMPYVGEAYFFRARAYGELVFHWGDVPYYTEDIDIHEARSIGRTTKTEVLQHVYDDFDKAASILPVNYVSDQRVTKGAVYAFKARYALYLGDYATAAVAAKNCMELEVYSLQDDYSKLFLPSTTTSPEFIFIMPRSIEAKLNVLGNGYVKNMIIRAKGGWDCYDPTWDLLAAYTCTDGLPIDESPLFDPHNPFKNRDPRCTMSICEFGSYILGYEYNPSPVALTCGKLNGLDTLQVYNNETRVNKFYASFNGLIWRKYVDQSWVDNGYKADNVKILMRYADVLLMYAEAKIELGEIDQSVIDAMNEVRSRAYGVDRGQTDMYPAFTIKSQGEMRYDLRLERRMELAGECLRYPDIIRWKIAPIVLNRKVYMMVDPSNMQALYDAGNWFWGITPTIDGDGCADFTALENAGMCVSASERKWDDRQYLWPIPTTEIEINSNMTQNPGY